MRLPEFVVTAFHGFAQDLYLAAGQFGECCDSRTNHGDELSRLATIASRIERMNEDSEYDVEVGDRLAFHPDKGLELIGKMRPVARDVLTAFLDEYEKSLQLISRDMQCRSAWQRFLEGGDYDYLTEQYTFEKSGPLSCSFCGKTQAEVRKLIAGPSVAICDECVTLCNEITAAG